MILREEVKRLSPGGIHSNVRMAGPRVVIERANGAWLYDVDGNHYVDPLLGQGPNFLGHAPNVILDFLDEASRSGMIYGGQHPLENQAAKLVLDATAWPELMGHLGRLAAEHGLELHIQWIPRRSTVPSVTPRYMTQHRRHSSTTSGIHSLRRCWWSMASGSRDEVSGIRRQPIVMLNWMRLWRGSIQR